MRELAQDAGTSVSTVKRVLIEDLNYVGKTRKNSGTLSPAQSLARCKKAKKPKYMVKGMFLEKIVFPDDKISTLNDIAERKQFLAYGPVETPPTPYQRTISKALHQKG